MATPALVLPAHNQPLVDGNGLLTVPGRASLQNAINNLQAQITAIAALEGDATALEAALAALQAELDAAEAAIAAHIADTANPHATTAAQVGADPVGTATAAVAAHVALVDPHTQYLTEAAATAGYQPLDATLTALAGANWAANALPIGSGADTVSQVAFAANTFPARASSGNLVAKAITDGALSALAGSGGTAGFLRGDGAVSSTITTEITVEATAFPASYWLATSNAVDTRLANVFLSAGGDLVFNVINDANTISYGSLSVRRSGNVDLTGQLNSASTIKPGTYTVATLPAAGLVAGMRATVTDATAPTYLGALTGGGSVTCGVIYNGAAWVAG